MSTVKFIGWTMLIIGLLKTILLKDGLYLGFILTGIGFIFIGEKLE